MPFTAGNTPEAPRSVFPALLEALAADLRAVGYTVDGVAELLGETAHAALGRDQLIPALSSRIAPPVSRRRLRSPPSCVSGSWPSRSAPGPSTLPSPASARPG